VVLVVQEVSEHDEPIPSGMLTTLEASKYKVAATKIQWQPTQRRRQS
jgi:hypothetical protein